MTILTQKLLKELNKSGVSYKYAIGPKGHDFYISSTGKNYGEAFENFANLLEKECQNYAGVCEVRESDEHKLEGIICLIERIISKMD